MSTNVKKDANKAKYVWQNPVLDAQGREVISPVSLVAVADLRPISMAERVRRYMRLPQFIEDQKNLTDLWADNDWDENLDPDEVPISKYEDRAREVAARIQARRAKEAADLSAQKADADKKKYEEWSAHFEELRQKGSSPRENPTASPPIPNSQPSQE